MPADSAAGFLLVGIAILLILGLVFAVSARATPSPPRPRPPRGVHMPDPSPLPVLISVGGALIAAGLAFRPEDALANWFLLVPGLLVFLSGIVAWVRAANREWRDTDRGAHHDGPAH
jgi:hypothetical protein